MRNSAVVLTDSEDDRSAMDVDVDVESRRELGSGEASLPWVEKYRPEELSGLVSQENIVSTVSRLLESNRLPHLLFYGPAGTGKTTAALAIAKKLNGAKFQSMTLELNASDQRGIAVVRDRIKTFASTQQIFQSGCKFVILDEADAMTSAAQFSLRRIMEKYTKNTRFCIICNYVNKIIPALQSRCMRFRFSPLKKELVFDKLRSVANEEGVSYNDEGLQAILQLSNGDMRKCLNTLQATSLAYPLVDEKNVYICTGNASPGEMRQILDVLLNSNFSETYEYMARIQVERGYALSDTLREIQSLLLCMPDLPDASLRYVLKGIAQIEYDLSHETSQQLQVGALVGIFQKARQLAFQAASS